MLPTPVFWPRELHGLYIVHGVTKSQTQLSDFHSLTHSLTRYIEGTSLNGKERASTRNTKITKGKNLTFVLWSKH